MELYYLPEDFIPDNKVEILSDTPVLIHKRIIFKSPFTSPHDVNNIVPIEVFTPVKVRSKTTVIFVHGLGINKRRKKLYILLPQRLAESGYQTVFFTMPYHLERRPEGKTSLQWFSDLDDVETLKFYHQCVVDIMATMNILSDTKDFCITGISLGSMISTIAMANDSRITKGVLILGGGNYEKIIWHSLTKYIIREGYCNSKMCKHFYSTFEKYRRKVENSISWRYLPTPKICFLFDPLTFAPFLRNKKVTMINALFDVLIPRSATIQLWEALGKPEIHWLFAGHGSTLFRGTKIARLLKDFLQKDF